MKNTQLLLTLVSLLIAPVHAIAEGETDPSIACLLALESKPELRILKDKVALSDVRTQTLEMLASNKKPSKPEKAALSLWVAEGEGCKKLGDEWRAKNYPASVIALAERNLAEQKSMIADLYGGQLTYGAFAKSRSAKFAAFNGELTELVQKILAERKAQQERELAESKTREEKKAQQARADRRREQDIEAQIETRRQAIEQELAQSQAQDQQARRNAALMYLMNQRPYQIPVPQAPITTNCINSGVTINCTTR